VKVVVKLTGKLFDLGNVDILKSYCRIIRDRFLRGYRFAIVCGGGSTARHYINMARKLGVSESWSDLLGINVSRVNALLMNAALGDIAYSYIPKNVDEVLTAWSSGKVVTLGGLQPGQSTNAVAMVIAELVGADLVVNATDVDGVYDKDPKKYSDARLLPKITINELKNLISSRSEAGTYELFDQLAISIAERSKIKIYFVNGFKPENIEKVLDGINVGSEVIYT
jgi:uridylate kinase